MRIDRSLLNWGVFFIALGGIPLAVDQGWLEPDIARDLGQLWPLILVGIGLGLILRWTPIAWFGGALVAATFGVIFGAALAALPDDDISTLQGIIPAIAVGACSGDQAGSASSSAGDSANAERFELDVTLSCGELSVSRATTNDWSLEARHAPDDAPAVDAADLDGATAVVRLDQQGRDDLVFLGTQVRSDWRVGVPATATLTTRLTLNAVRGEVDAGSGPVAEMAGTFNASDVTLDLATASTPARSRVELTANASDLRLLLADGNVDATVTLNASSLSMCVPQVVALRVDLGSNNLSSDNLAASGLEEGDPTLWTTPGFSTAGDHVNVSLSSTVSSFTLERPESCS